MKSEFFQLTVKCRNPSTMNPMFKEVGTSNTESWKKTYKELPFSRETRRRSQAWDANELFRLNMTLTAENPGDSRYLWHHIVVSFRGFEEMGPIPISGFPTTLDEIQGRCRAV